ncbi:MAG: hypothetical protein ACD_58C00146G0002 [uncultured bacterium]|nr:MAG: hypothetical protein ACD_58C00146G0002 [uncultured bacterium]
MTQIVDGKLISQKILNKISQKVAKAKIKPTLAVILVGSDPASQLYVRIKEKICQKVGIGFIRYDFADNISKNTILDLINKLNNDKSISGIIIQLPLPTQLDTNQIISAISPNKDVDGLNAINIKKLSTKKPGIIPPTPAAILEILKYYKININNKNIVLVGYGKLVNKPLYEILKSVKRTNQITICDKDTVDLANITKKADILITATGVANLITKNMIKKGAVVIDAGTTVVINQKSKIKNQKITKVISGISEKRSVVGDVDFEEVKEIASLITAPTGGVGPITVAKLLENVVNANK